MMENQGNNNFWESVFVPAEAVARSFISEKTGKPLCEVVLPKTMPEGAPNCGGWHFYMPGTCVHDVKSGDKRLSFPPSWTSMRFLSPYVKGQRSDSLEMPVEDALAMLRDAYARPKKA